MVNSTSHSSLSDFIHSFNVHDLIAEVTEPAIRVVDLLDHENFLSVLVNFLTRARTNE